MLYKSENRDVSIAQADAETGAEFLARLRRLSLPYGTEIAVADGAGIVRP